jgi:hypothetical protein
MNERIQELSDIAYKNHLARNPNSSFGRRSDYDREFAELMVRECVAVMYDNAIERRVPPDIDKTPAHYAVAVLKHFGIES